jgi:hypothetical protein
MGMAAAANIAIKPKMLYQAAMALNESAVNNTRLEKVKIRLIAIEYLDYLTLIKYHQLLLDLGIDGHNSP